MGKLTILTKTTGTCLWMRLYRGHPIVISAQRLVSELVFGGANATRMDGEGAVPCDGRICRWGGGLRTEAWWYIRSSALVCMIMITSGLTTASVGKG